MSREGSGEYLIASRTTLGAAKAVVPRLCTLTRAVKGRSGVDMFSIEGHHPQDVSCLRVCEKTISTCTGPLRDYAAAVARAMAGPRYCQPTQRLLG